MKFGRLIAAVIVLAALGATLFWSNRRKAAQDAAAASGTPGINIISVKQDDVSKLEIKKKDEDDILLSRAGGDNWKITSPKPLTADHETVSTILYDLSPLKAEQVVEEKAGDLKQYGLAPPSVEVSPTSNDGKSQKLLIGDDTPTGGNAYAMLEGDPRIFTIGVTYKTNMAKGLKDLRDKRMLPLDFDKLAKVEVAGPKLNVSFIPDTANPGKWLIQSPKDMRADSSTLADIVDKVRLATMDLGASDADMKKSAALFASGTPVATVKVSDASGTQEMQVRKNKDDYYAKSSAMDGASKVSNELGADINKSTEDFREKWLLDLRDDTPNKVELHDGSKSYFLTRTGDDWWSDGKKMDPMSVENFLGTVRGLTAEKFVPSGFSNPTIAITVTSNDGKRVEKVEIAKSGSDYIGKRENSPLLYQMTAKNIEDMQKAADSVRPVAPAPATK